MSLSSGQNTSLSNIPNEDRTKYQNIFRQWDASNSGFLDGSKARDLFSQSGLQPSVLFQIWNLADSQNRGKLDIHEFSVAMHLIHWKLSGNQIPQQLPPQLLSSSSMNFGQQNMNNFNGLNNNSNNWNASQNNSSTPVSSVNSNQTSQGFGAQSNSSSISRQEFESLKAQLESKKMLLNSKNQSKKFTESDIDELKARIKVLYPKAPFHNPNFPKDLKQLNNSSGKTDSKELTQIAAIEEKIVSLNLEASLNDLISKATSTSLKLKDAYLELFKLQDSQKHGYKLPSNKKPTFPSTTPASNDPIAQKAAAMLAQRMQMLNLNKQASMLIPSDAEDRIGTENQSQEQRQIERDQAVSKLKNEITQLNKEFSSLISSLKGLSDQSGESELKKLESERKKFEEGYGLKSYRANRLLDELKQLSSQLVYPPETVQQTKQPIANPDDLFSPTQASNNSPFAPSSRSVGETDTQPANYQSESNVTESSNFTFDDVAQSSRRARDQFLAMENAQPETTPAKATGMKWHAPKHDTGFDTAFDSLSKQKELEKQNRIKAKEEDRKRRQLYEEKQNLQDEKTDSIQSAARAARERARQLETSTKDEPIISPSTNENNTHTKSKSPTTVDNHDDYPRDPPQSTVIPPPPPPPPPVLSPEPISDQNDSKSDLDSQEKPSLGDSLFGVSSPPLQRGHSKKLSASNPFNTTSRESTTTHNPFMKPKQPQAEQTATNDDNVPSLSEHTHGETLFTVIALYDYDNENGFIFNEGDRIAVTVADDDNPDWWCGYLESNPEAEDWFPQNYVNKISDELPESNQVQPLEEPEPIQEPEPEPEPEPETILAETLFDYTAEHGDELTVLPGMKVTVLDQSDPDWWTAQTEDGTVGLLPASYLNILNQNGISHKLKGSNHKIVPEKNNSTIKNGFNHNSSKNNIKMNNNFNSGYDGDKLDPKFHSKQVSVGRSDIRRGSNSGIEPNKIQAYFAADRRASSTSSLAHPASPSESNISSYFEDPISNTPYRKCWSTIVPPDMLKTFSPLERKRQEAIFELISTERTYLKDLQIIVELFLTPLDSYLTIEERNKIFSNLEELVLINTQFLSELENLPSKKDMSVEGVGKVFLQYCPEFEQYSTYCSNQAASSKYIQSRKKSDPKFDQMLNNISQKPQCRQLNLMSFLLEPVQRVTRYPMLLRQIIKYTPEDHFDYPLLYQSIEQLEDCLKRLNQDAQYEESQQRLIELSRTIDLERCPGLNITGMTRFLGARVCLMEGPLLKSKKGKKLHLFLFNDMLLITLPDKDFNGPIYTLYRPPIPLAELSVKELSNEKSMNIFSSNDENCFQLIHAKETIIFKCSGVSVRKKWINEFNQAINICRETQRQCFSTLSYRQENILEVLAYLQFTLCCGNDLKIKDDWTHSELNTYCKARIGDEVFCSQVVYNSNHPQYNQSHIFHIVDFEAELRIQLYSINHFQPDDFIGETGFSISQLLELNQSLPEIFTLELSPTSPDHVSSVTIQVQLSN